MSDTVEIVIKARDEVSRTVGGIRGSLSGLTGALGPVAAVGRVAFAGIGAAAVGGFGLAMNSAIDMNSMLEQSTMQFTTLMGDADKAAEHVAALFEFGAKTPFETEPIITASKHLQIFGGEALNTMDNLTLIGDAAAAVGAPIDEVSFWVGRLYSNLQAGQPFGEAAMRLQELGIMAPGTRMELESLQEAGASGAEIFGEFQTSLGDFTGAMDMQSQSWTGLVSTIKDQLGLLMADALKPFFDLAKEGLGALAEWLQSPDVQEGIQNLATGFKNLIANVTEFVQTAVIPFVQEHGPLLKNILIGIGVALGGLMIIGAISALITVALNPVMLIILAVAGVVALLKTAWDNNWGGIQEKTAAAWDFIKPKLEAIRDWITGVVIPALQELWAKWVNEVWPAIKAALEEAWSRIQPILEAVGNFITDTLIPKIQELYEKWVTEVWPKIETAIDNAWTIIEEIFTEIGRWINDNIVPWIEFLHDKWVNDVWPAIQSAIESAWEIIEPIWEAIRKWAAETIPPIIEALRGIFENVMGGIKAAIQPVKEVWDGFVGAVERFWNWITGKVFNFQINLPDLPDWARPGSPLPIHTRWREFADDMYDIGRAIADGFITAFSTLPNVMAGLDFLLSKMNDISGLAGGFGSIFTNTVLDPLAGQMAGIEGELANVDNALEGMLGTLGLNIHSGTLFRDLQEIIAGDSQEDRFMAMNAIAFLEQRARLMDQLTDMQEDYAGQEARLLILEQQRAQIGFLQQQFDLLKLIQENGLDASLLQGLELGLNADPGALMDAMIAALQAMIQAAEDELGINSPSKWAQDTMSNVMETMAATVRKGSAWVRGSLSLAPERVMAGGGGAASVSNVTVHIDARNAERGVERDIRRVVDQVMREYGMKADIRLRTTG